MAGNNIDDDKPHVTSIAIDGVPEVVVCDATHWETIARYRTSGWRRVPVAEDELPYREADAKLVQMEWRSWSRYFPSACELTVRTLTGDIMKHFVPPCTTVHLNAKPTGCRRVIDGTITRLDGYEGSE